MVGCAASTPTPPDAPAPASPPPAETAQDDAPAPASASPFADAAVKSALAYSASKSGHAVLILHDGQPIASAFQNGWEPSKPHPLASGTKSFWGPLVVAAIDDGLLSGFDERASETLEAWKADPARADMTIRQLLALTSGLKADLGVTMETVPDSDMHALAVAAPGEHPPGSKWAYSDSAHTAVGAVLERKLAAKGSSLERYLEERLLAPLGIDSPDWQRDGAGHLLMPSGARLLPAQWAAFGELIRNAGIDVRGERVLSAEHLAACFEPSKAPPAGQFYGLGWWLTTYTSFKYDLPSDMVIAGGSGGQFLFVMPSAKLTIVRFGDSEDFVDGEFLCRLFHGTGIEGCPTR